MSSDLWKRAPEGATHYYIGSISPWRDLSAEDWNWWQDGKWHSPHDEQYAGLTGSVDTSSAGLIRRSGAYLMARPNPSDMKP